MEDTDLLKLSGMSAGTLTVILIVYRVLKSMNGKRFISQCCSKRYDVGFTVKDLDSDTPEHTQNPLKNITVKVDESQGNDYRRDTRGTSKDSCGVSEAEGVGRLHQGARAICCDGKRPTEGREGEEKKDEAV
jgi:hypothetical protein